MENTILDPVADRIARRSLAGRGADYSAEVRRLLDAGRTVMRRCGTETRPRVADIVAESGLSNDAFYRHFKSKDALVTAILEDGTLRLRSYLAHRIEKVSEPGDAVREWIDGVLAQAGDDSAATTAAVLWNAGALDQTVTSPSTAEILAPLIVPALAELGSPDAESDALLIAHGVIGSLSDHLRSGRRPTKRFVEGVVAFHLAAVDR